MVFISNKTPKPCTLVIMFTFAVTFHGIVKKVIVKESLNGFEHKKTKAGSGRCLVKRINKSGKL